MVPDLVFYQLALIVLVWLFIILHGVWLSDRTTARQSPPAPTLPQRKRSRAPRPFAGLTRKPSCEACEQAPSSHPQVSCAPPPYMILSRGRRRQVDTSSHFCSHAHCSYRGWVGRGNIRANGHPRGHRWRQLYCLGCKGYFQETHGTPFHGKHVPPDLLVRAISALAEGLGIRAVARVFEVDPNTVLAWLVEVADHAVAFSRYFLHDVHVNQVQLDELFALLSAVKDGEVTETEAIQRLSRSPHWVWVAMDPESKLLLTIDVGTRTLAMAQCVVHQVAQVLAPDCAPLFLTDGFRE
jgi:transposase-like protein